MDSSDNDLSLRPATLLQWVPYMRLVSPISQGEFLHLFQRCTPPGGWPNRIGVANSGGPDSTCLLYLLSSVIREKRGSAGFPSQVLSVHINHALQDSSHEMATRAEDTARKLNVTYYTSVIPWGTAPFPPLPSEGQPVEQLARDARYHQLFHSAMLKGGLGALAQGHHADDQVETAIMRISMGSGDVGAGGMRPVRRWGMGDNGSLTYFGYRGMSRWIVRPLLSIPKDRILATCEKHGLDYVNDPTNFQPSLTLRNAIRYTLAQEKTALPSESQINTDVGAESLLDQHPNVKAAIWTLRAQSPIPGNDGLRDAVKILGDRLAMVDTQVDNHLAASMFPSPRSVVMLRSDRLARITEHEVRIAMVRRILRYVSPRMWGSIQAEAGGHRRSFETAVAHIWNTLEAPAARRSFAVGSNVVWVPGIRLQNGSFKRLNDRRERQHFVWLIQRATPLADAKLKRMGRESGLTRDITSLLSKPPSSSGHDRILYDMRFLIQFDLSRVPENLLASIKDDAENTKVVIEPATSWFAPQVVWRRAGQPDEILSHFKWDAWHNGEESEVAKEDSSWLKVSSVRTLEAI